MDRYEPVVIVAPGRSPPRTARKTSKKTSLARTGAAYHRRTAYWAVAVVLSVWWLLRVRKSPLLAISPSTPSTFACQGDSLDTRRCVFQNVVVQRGVIYYYAEDPLFVTVPPMLCSMVNTPKNFAAPCDVRILSDSTAFAKLLAKTKKTQHFNLGLTLSRVNPGNAYHLLFEDMIPAMALIYKASNITRNEPLPALLHTLKQQHWGLFLTDHHKGEHMDKYFWREFYPEVSVLQASNDVSYRVETLLAGTATTCIHWGHCQPTDRTIGIYDPPDAAVALRKVVFHRNGIVEEEDGAAATAAVAAATPAPRQEGPPRVTLVQRSTTRRIRNLKEVESTIKSLMGVSPRVIDMSDLSIKEQVLLTHNTDIFILVHGGAMANLLWLPPGALIIDIYPHEFLLSYHSAIMHWIRKALEPAIQLGHMPFQVETAEGQELLSGPMREGCVCRSYQCQKEVFRASAFISVDAVRFKEHLKEGLRAWREGGREGAGYEKAIAPEEFARRQSKVDREREARPGYYSAPVCWDDT